MTTELIGLGLHSSKFYNLRRFGEKWVISSLNAVVPELIGVTPCHQLIDDDDDLLKPLGMTEEQIGLINTALTQLAKDKGLIG